MRCDGLRTEQISKTSTLLQHSTSFHPSLRANLLFVLDFCSFSPRLTLPLHSRECLILLLGNLAPFCHSMESHRFQFTLLHLYLHFAYVQTSRLTATFEKLHFSHNLSPSLKRLHNFLHFLLFLSFSAFVPLTAFCRLISSIYRQFRLFFLLETSKLRFSPSFRGLGLYF